MDNISAEKLGADSQAILATVDLSATSFRDVREQLEKKFKYFVFKRKKEFDKIIMNFDSSQHDDEDEGGSEEENNTGGSGGENGVEEEKITAEIHALLDTADLSVTTARDVREQVEKNLQCSLHHRKKEFDKIIMDFVRSQHEDQDEGQSEEENNTDGSGGENGDEEERMTAEIQAILETANLSVTSARDVQEQIEKNLKCSLFNRKKELDKIITDLVNTPREVEDEGESEQEHNIVCSGGGNDDEEEEITAEIHALLDTADLTATTTRDVLEHADKSLCSLFNRKKNFDKIIMDFFGSQHEDEDEGESEEENNTDGSGGENGDVEEKITSEIHSLLDTADLSVTTARDVREQLEKNLQCSFISRKKDLDKIIMDFVRSQHEDVDEGESEEENHTDGGGGENGDEEEKITAEIQAILETADLSVTSARDVREQVEKNLQCSLFNRKKQLDKIIMGLANTSRVEEDEGESEKENNTDCSGGGNGAEEEKITAEIHALLDTADLSATTARDVLEQVQNSFQRSELHGQKELDEIIMDVVSSQHEDDDEGEIEREDNTDGGNGDEEEKITAEIHAHFHTADLSATTPRDVLEQEETNFQRPVLHCQKELDEIIMDVVSSQHEDENEEESEEKNNTVCSGGGNGDEKEKISAEIHTLLDTADLSATTARDVLEQVEKSLCSLFNRKKDNDKISDSVGSQHEDEDEGESEEENKADGSGGGNGDDEEKITAEIHALLDTADLSVTTARDVREQLENNLQCSLINRKKELDKIMMAFVRTHHEDEDEGESEEENHTDGSGGENGDKEEKVTAEIQAILDTSDLSVTTARNVREQVEKTLKCSLQHRKKELDKIIMDFVSSQHEDEDERKSEEENNIDGSGGDNDDEVVSSEEVKRPAKKRSDLTEYIAAPSKKKCKSLNPSDFGTESDGSDDSDVQVKKKKKKAAYPKKKEASGTGGALKLTGFRPTHSWSPEFSSLMSAESLPDHGVAQEVWSIIEESNLYDPKN